MNKLTKNELLENLAEISDVILANDIDYNKLRESLVELKKLFFEVSDVQTNAPEYIEDIHHETGKAIGPKWAELCIDDIMRTKRFSKGAFHAIEDRKKQNPNKPVTLLYIGTGPFATLILPLLTKFKPEDLQLVLVEVNPISVGYLKNCLKNLGFEAYVKEIISADAAQLHLENPLDIDILLLECLQFALVKEQQVAITYNLIPQLRNDVILLPQEIKLSISAIDSFKKMKFMTSNDTDGLPVFYKNLNTVFVLNKEEILCRKSNSEIEIFDFEKVTTLLSNDDKNEFTSIAIATDILVYGNQKLGMDECSLTMSFKLSEMEKAKNYTSLTTKYIVNKSPGLNVEWL